jgi:Uma2 family endonuclease
MSTDLKLITAAEFAAMTLDGRFELVRGELVEMNQPNVRHGIVCGTVSRLLGNWADANNGGIVASHDSGVLTERDPDTVRGPDVFFVRRDRWPGGEALDTSLEIAPDLAVEVISPSNRWPQVVAKIGEYLQIGVPEVWAIEPLSRRVHVYRPDDEPFILGEQDDLTTDVLPDFRCKVVELFKDA